MRKLVENPEEYSFGIITQRGYKGLQDQIHTWIVRGLIAVGIIAFFCTVSMVGFGILLDKQGNTTAEIQDQRYSLILGSCLDQNKRHDKVVAQIDAAVAAVPPPPARQKRARESAKPFKLILEAAVPYTTDCPAIARKRTQSKP